ncbi:MAG TPA: ABC transporter ATP-binding protein/permease [Candidatus Ornithospirochaeta avicola]|uniref:ABC transporter ATP-binding protein/permease n=1 Tax=Candidatus Ornithospirochaeta avicola TaxID=2840896 RepID=A0A9D1PTW3_9SPIO|nr:ABC transporter ATP-binding protein/permease [Candidatus Ornithospirochaeta avicola]
MFKTIKKTAVYLKKSRLLVVLSFIFALLSVISALLVPYLAGLAVDYIIDENDVDFASIFPLALEILISAAVYFITLYLMQIVNNRIAYKVTSSIRRDAFFSLVRLPSSFIDTHKTGDLVSRITSDIDIASDGLLLGFSQLFTAIITVLGTLVLLFSINWALALAVVILTPLSLFVASFIAKRTHRTFQTQAEERGNLTDYVEQSLNNAEEIKSYNHEEVSLEEMKEINNRYADASMKATFFSSITNPATRFVNNVVYAIVALLGAVLAIRGNITVGLLSVCLSYATQYTKPFNDISQVITELENAFVCFAHVFELIDEKKDSDDGTEHLDGISDGIRFDNLSFSYDKSRKLLEDINIDIKKGSTVAIVGPTGSGKTTIINLLMRFYDPDKGRILIDGKDISSFTKKSLRDNIALVLQDTFILKASVKDNILMGRKYSDEDVFSAAKKSQADSFISRLSSSYDTMLSNEDTSLSEGERQMIAITRVMLSDAPILILDEATSSIDTRTEKIIQTSFDRLKEGRTSFIVAHRLSTIVNADLVLVLKDGNIIESGSHKELLEKKGFYSDLYESQYKN